MDGCWILDIRADSIGIRILQQQEKEKKTIHANLWLFVVLCRNVSIGCGLCMLNNIIALFFPSKNYLIIY